VKKSKRSASPRSVLGERVHPDLPTDRLGAYEQVFTLARRIPRGRVMTYGQIAASIAHRLSARAVGWAMHGCPSGVPWQRVVNASGGCSTDRIPDIPEGLQRAMLEREGIEFRENGTLDLERYRWIPPEDRGRGDGRVAVPNKRSRRR
jgi:methylated-DNA-protein-cysteine methyltransferase-like protein